MKKVLLTILLALAAQTGFSQYVEHLSAPKRIGLFGGAGLATAHNYDVGVSGGLDFHMWLQGGTYIGALLFLQGHSLYYDNEANGAKDTVGYAGMTFRHESKYVFFCPKLSKILWYRTNFIPWLYIYGGAGFKMSGYDSVRKWDRGFGPTYPGYYDSTIDGSKNLKSMAFRVGFGFAQDIYVGGNFWFTFKEDFAFTPGSLTTSGQIGAGSPAHTQYTADKISPTYISLQLGISYIKAKSAKTKTKS